MRGMRTRRKHGDFLEGVRSYTARQIRVNSFSRQASKGFQACPLARGVRRGRKRSIRGTAFGEHTRAPRLCP